MNALKASLVKLVLRLCSLLPLSAARALGRGLMRLYWPVGGRSRKVTERNIQLAFPELSESEQQQLARRSLCATGELTTEMGHVWMRPWPYVQGLILDVHGSAVILEAQEAGRQDNHTAPRLLGLENHRTTVDVED